MRSASFEGLFSIVKGPSLILLQCLSNKDKIVFASLNRTFRDLLNRYDKPRWMNGIKLQFLIEWSRKWVRANSILKKNIGSPKESMTLFSPGVFLQARAELDLICFFPLLHPSVQEELLGRDETRIAVGDYWTLLFLEDVFYRGSIAQPIPRIIDNYNFETLQTELIRNPLHDRDWDKMEYFPMVINNPKTVFDVNLYYQFMQYDDIRPLKYVRQLLKIDAYTADKFSKKDMEELDKYQTEVGVKTVVDIASVRIIMQRRLPQ